MAILETALHSRKKGTLQTTLHPYQHIFLSVSYNWKLCFPSCVFQQCVCVGRGGGAGRRLGVGGSRTKGAKTERQTPNGSRTERIKLFLFPPTELAILQKPSDCLWATRRGPGSATQTYVALMAFIGYTKVSHINQLRTDVLRELDILSVLKISSSQLVMACLLGHRSP